MLEEQNSMSDISAVSNTSAEGTISTFTFYVSDSLFAVETNKVLSVKEDLDNIQRIPVGTEAIRGVYKYQDTVVPVYEFSSLISMDSGQQVMQDLIDNLFAREQDHVDWLDDLEASIVDGVPFTKALDPHKCAFGKWYDSFTTRDETLQEILNQFDEPHKHIHSLAEKLLSLRNQDKAEQALEELKLERHTTLRRLKSLFNKARDQIKGVMRPVIIFITENGVDPKFGMVVDEINDVIIYSEDSKQENLSISENTSDFSQCLLGMYVKQGGPDSIICDIDAMINRLH